jgi:lipoate-protein ligase B
LTYFQYIVPCGLTKPVTSMERLGVRATVQEVGDTLAGHFGRILDCNVGQSVRLPMAEQSSPSGMGDAQHWDHGSMEAPELV